jgi:peptidyl-prolyl cis-trans isomerase SurA
MRIVGSIILLFTVVRPAFAQPVPGAGVERTIGHVVAVVGDSAIFSFTIEEGVNARAAQRRLQAPPPPGPELEQWKREVLEERINELLILQAALRDTTIRVTDDQLTRSVQQDIEQRQQQMGGAAAFERLLRASGLTLSSYRELLEQQQRSAALVQQYVQRARQRRKAPPVSEQELRAYFDSVRDQLPPRPPTVSFQQIHVLTQPTEAAMARAKQLADSIYQLVLAKEDFAELARRFNSDGTRETGGDLGWFRRGMMIRDFENVAFSMLPGTVSPPVRTRHGYHLIKVERVKGSEIQARHILIAPELTTEDALRARARADTVAQRLRDGADAAALARQYGDPDETVRVPAVEVTRPQEEFGTDLSNAAAGEVIGPVPVGGNEVAARFVVLKILQREGARPRTLDDLEVRDRLRQDLEFQKLFAEIIAELRRSTYVDIRKL